MGRNIYYLKVEIRYDKNKTTFYKKMDIVSKFDTLTELNSCPIIFDGYAGLSKAIYGTAKKGKITITKILSKIVIGESVE